MTVVLTSHAPSKELYQQVADAAGVERDPPEGLIVHTASELPDGTVRIVDVWESRARGEAFERTRLASAFASVGVPADGPERELIEAFHTIR